MSWTDERVEMLRQLWGSGKSASEIAQVLGGISRNAVIGKAHRLGLSGRPSPIKRRDPNAAPAPSSRSGTGKAAASGNAAAAAGPSRVGASGHGAAGGSATRPATDGQANGAAKSVSVARTSPPSQGSAGIRPAEPGPSAAVVTAPMAGPSESTPAVTAADVGSGTPARMRTVGSSAGASDMETGSATILSLTERMCRWPIGDPRDQNFRFCGRKAVAGMPYCADHCRMAYQQPQPKGARKDESDRKAQTGR